MRMFFLAVVLIGVSVAVSTGALQAEPGGALYVTQRPTEDLYRAAAAPSPTLAETPPAPALPGPDYAATAAAAGALAELASAQTRQALELTAVDETRQAAQTADARAAYAFGLTQAAGDAAMTATALSIAGTQAAATKTAAPVTQAFLATVEAHRTQIVVDERDRTDSRERWTWATIAGSLGLVVALIAGGFALYDWLAGRTAVERAEADRIRLIAVEEARARRQAILAMASAAPAQPADSSPAPRMPIEVAGQPLPQHPADVMHVLYVLSRSLDLAGDTSTALPTAAKLQAAGISANARQAAVGPLVAAGLVVTTPGGGTRVGGGLTLRQLYDAIYAGGLPAPAPAEVVMA